MSDNPEHLRLLRLRTQLDSIRAELTEVEIETHVSDPWFVAIHAISSDLTQANGIVLSSLKAFRGDAGQVVK